MITEKEPTLSAQDQADATQDVISREDILLAELKDMAAQKLALEKRVQDRFHEIVLLTRIISDYEATIVRNGKKLEWFRQVLAVFTKQYSRSRNTKIMKWMPSYFWQKRINKLLIKQNLFDPEIYTNMYPDVLSHNIDPFRHYILHGLKEGRFISRNSTYE